MQSEMQENELAAVFAANLRARRLKLGMTQQQLADALGVHVPYISNLENGKKTPYVRSLARFAEALQTTPDKLLRPPKKTTEMG